MTFKKRVRPDLPTLERWLASDEVQAGDGRRCRARSAFLIWSDYAVRSGVEAGSPRAFANELRRRGFPTAKLDPRRPSRKHHLGLSLTNPYRKRSQLSADERWRRILVEVKTGKPDPVLFEDAVATDGVFHWERKFGCLG